MLDVLPASKWICTPRPDSQAELRLWCFPFAGGGASAWFPWSNRLAGVAEVVALRLPGRESRLSEPALCDFERLVDSIASEVARQSRTRYIFFGHSLGALLAFEVALLLRTRGVPLPIGLVVSGARAPSMPRMEPHIHHLPDGELIVQVDARYNGIPPAVRNNPEFLELFLPALRADLTAFETYRHRDAPPLAIPVLAMGGKDDPCVSSSELLAWQAHVSGPIAADFFPGGHFFVQSEVAAVVSRIESFLKQVAK